MVAMEGISLGDNATLDGLGKHDGQAHREGGSAPHANAAPGVKTSSASEVSPQTIKTVPSGNGGAHQHASDVPLDSSGPEKATREDALGQGGENTSFFCA